MYSLPILEREIKKAKPVYGNTVRFEIAELVVHGIATTDEIESWAIANDGFAWMEGASNPVVRNVYRGRLKQLVCRDGKYFTHLFVSRNLIKLV